MRTQGCIGSILSGDVSAASGRVLMDVQMVTQNTMMTLCFELEPAVALRIGKKLVEHGNEGVDDDGQG